MSTAHIAYCLLLALGAASNTPSVPATSTPAIEVLIAGPREARERMDAAIRPLLGDDPDVRWGSSETVPSNRALPEHDEGASPTGQSRQIWIDVTHPGRLRVYLPAAEATTIRTLKAEPTDGEEVDMLAAEAVGQIVKAAVLSLRHGTEDTSTGTRFADGVPGVSAARSSASEVTHPQDGLFLRLAAGYGSVHVSESTGYGSFRQFGPTFGAAVGAKVARNLILYGEVRTSGMRSTNDSYPATPGFLLVSFGPGVAYYFEPSNWYVSGTIGLAKAASFHASADYQVPDPDMGYSGSFTVGKEWWLGRRWGLGLAGQYNLASMNHYNVVYGTPESQMQVTSLSLLVSARYH